MKKFKIISWAIAIAVTLLYASFSGLYGDFAGSILYFIVAAVLLTLTQHVSFYLLNRNNTQENDDDEITNNER